MRPIRLPRRTLLIGAGAFAIAACTEDRGDQPDASTGANASTNPETTATSDPPPTTADVPVTDDSAVPATDAPAATETIDDTGPQPLTVEQFAALPVCSVLPSSTSGPFPTIEQLERRDVTEGLSGHPLRLGVRVVDDACAPVANAQIEIWHTDATGDYSSYADGGSGKDDGEGTTFMRGFQTTDADGIAEFQTIYPGWYGGRAVHIHTTVRRDGAELLTAQLYFDEAYTEEIFRTEPYAAFGPPDTTWATDPIAGDPAADGTATTLVPAPTWLGPGTLGLVNVGVPT